MWWIYFDIGAEPPASCRKSAQSRPFARLAYTYMHLLIVAGIILSAVADELLLKHPGGHSDAKTVVAAVGGPLLFLVGTILFKHAIRGFLQLSHGVGIIAFAAVAWFGTRSVAALAVDPHHRDPDHGRGVGIAVAARSSCGIARAAAISGRRRF